MWLLILSNQPWEGLTGVECHTLQCSLLLSGFFQDAEQHNAIFCRLAKKLQHIALRNFIPQSLFIYLCSRITTCVPFTLSPWEHQFPEHSRLYTSVWWYDAHAARDFHKIAVVGMNLFTQQGQGCFKGKLSQLSIDLVRLTNSPCLVQPAAVGFLRLMLTRPSQILGGLLLNPAFTIFTAAQS